MSHPGFWNDEQNSTKVVKELKPLKSAVEPWEMASYKYQELKELTDILKDQDKELIADLAKNIDLLRRRWISSNLNHFRGRIHKNSAILSINAGAGGTESCDWVDALRMYSRFAESHGYSVKL